MSDIYALDTNALVFLASDRLDKLGKRARQVAARFERGEVSLAVSSAVLIELWFLMKAGRLRVETTLETWWNRLSSTGVLGIDLTADDVVTAADLDWDHRDPYDRLIVATALRYGCPLVTADVAIAGWGGIEVVW